ncbi:MAG: cspA 2 [Nocardioides sp.]|nr:cspA 2 [Nocardioides sp.]
MRSTVQHAIAAAALTVLATGCGSDTASTRTADEAPSPPAKFADVTPGGERGTVEFYDDGKGIGLIVTDEGKEITVYRRQIAEAGSVLSEGQRVRFEVVLGNRAPELMNVTVIEGASIVPFVGSDGLGSTVGTVKWFNDSKGFGFIATEDGEDIFVHFESVDEPGGISEGQRVRFDVVQGDKGPQATRVTLAGE